MSFACRVAAFDVREVAFDARPFCFLRNRILDVMCRVVFDLCFTTRFADFHSIQELLADFFPLVKEMRVELVSVTAYPESDMKIGHLPTMHVTRRQVDVADGEVPIVVHVIDKLICGLWTGFVRFMLSDFHLAGEER